MKTKLISLFLFPIMLPSASAFAAPPDSSAYQTAYLYADYGLATYKSELLKANDTNGVVQYGLGFNAGENDRVGMQLRSDTTTVTFAIPSSSLQTAWQDYIISARLSYFNLGFMLSSLKMTANDAGTDLFDLRGNGYGFYLNGVIPFDRRSFAYLTIMSTSISDIVEKDEKPVTVGPRLDVDLGSSFAVTRKVLDFVVGYRRRTYSVTAESASGNELMTATYFGFRLGTNF
jgi:hypothetical protein